MRRVVSLYLPHLATERRALAQRIHAAQISGSSPPEGALPKEEGRPVLLAAREGGRRVVTAVDQRASALGLHVGMAVSQAQARVPELEVAEADPAGDIAALARLAAWCLRLSPLTAACAPDGVWIDVTGGAHLFGGEDRLLRVLVDRLADAGLTARAAVADTPGCAHARARWGQADCETVPEGGVGAALEGLPVAALRLAPEVVAGLRRLGFDRVGQLMAAPRAPLTRRFGGDVARRLDQALGRAAEPIEPVLPPGLCRTRQSFPEPIATAEDLARATRMAAELLCDKLRRRDQGACRLDLVFQRVDGTAQHIRVGTAAPSRNAAHLARLLVAGIEGVDPGFGVESVMLSAPVVDRLGARQGRLLEGSGEADLSGLVDTLFNRLGEQRVFRVGSVESDWPERSVRRVAPMTRTVSSWPARLPRPVRLLEPPRRVDAMALLPDHPPARFMWRGCSHRVRRADGPERVFGEWWKSADETAAVRDYFQVEDEAGQRFWLFRRGDGENPGTGDLAWYLHGYFG